MTTMVYFDTLQYVEKLEEAGVPEKQAKAFAKVQQESLSECLDTTLATKTDLMEVKVQLQAEIHVIQSDVQVLKWMVGFVLTSILGLIVEHIFLR